VRGVGDPLSCGYRPLGAASDVAVVGSAEPADCASARRRGVLTDSPPADQADARRFVAPREPRAGKGPVDPVTLEAIPTVPADETLPACERAAQTVRRGLFVDGATQ
jgi:hypothetical protein